MQKYFYSFIIGILITTTAWFIFGRNNTTEIEATLNRANRDFEVVQRNISDFKSQFDGYTGRLSGSIEKANSLRDEIGNLRDEAGEHISELGGIKSGFNSIHGRIATVEESIRKGVIIGRDLSDLAYEYRRISEEYEKKN